MELMVSRRLAQRNDLVEGCTHDGREFRILKIVDEANRGRLAMIEARKLRRGRALGA
jgi:hypothetical protein